MRRAAWMIGLFLIVGGCRETPAEPPGEPPSAEYYGALPGLKATKIAALREELDRIVAEGGTPEQLAREPLADDDNVAAGLKGLFAEENIPAILEGSADLFPDDAFTFDPVGLRRIASFGDRFERERLRAREALGRPKCDFGVSFSAGMGVWSFIDVVEICGRLEAFRAAESLATGRVDEAIDSLDAMLRLAECLGAEKLVPARLQAAFLRTEAFRVLAAIVDHDRIGRDDLERLRAMVESQRMAWPDDANAWIGDRALGMHVYELVRDGRLVDLFSGSEVEQFEAEGTWEELVEQAERGVDVDELYYLEAMRKVIASCDQPYFARRAMFDALGEDLQQRRNTAEFPVVAVRVLNLPDVGEGNAIAAQDLANWEAWALALAVATGHEPPSWRVNPLTGDAYRFETVEGVVRVSNFGTGEDGDTPSIVLRAIP